MSAQTGIKGNPANKRMSNKALKERRARSYERGQTRKQRRREQQQAAARRNFATGTSPWSLARTLRYARRHAKTDDDG